MMKKRISLCLTCFLIFSLFCVAGCDTNPKSDMVTIPTYYMTGSSIIDTSNLAALVGDADYVFVGYVNEVVGTEYQWPVTIETEDGDKEITDPYTNYSVTVIDNIKGKLKKDTQIPVQKTGGISENGDYYVVYEGDVLPVVGEYYVFVAYGQPDGSLLSSGPNSTLSLGADVNQLKDDKTIKNIKEAYKNEIKRTRERFKSNYDEDVIG